MKKFRKVEVTHRVIGGYYKKHEWEKVEGLPDTDRTIFRFPQKSTGVFLGVTNLPYGNVKIEFENHSNAPLNSEFFQEGSIQVCVIQPYHDNVQYYKPFYALENDCRGV